MVQSTDAGIKPMETIRRWDKVIKTKREVTTPPLSHVIKRYNGHMDGIDKSNMLTHLYKSPMGAHRYYLKLLVML